MSLSATPDVLREVLDPILERARAEGRTHLLEPEGLALAQALGIGAPRFELLGSPEDVDALDLARFDGDQVVVKVVAADIQHKSDVGGVRFVAKERDAIAAAFVDLQARLGTNGLAGVMVAEFVPHDPSLGGQLLLGMRWTDEFGPVVTFGPGGVHAEFLARNLRPGRDAAILSPLFADAGQIDTALEASAITPAATGRLRGQASRMSLEDLRDVVSRFLACAARTMPSDILELEINPLVWTERGPVALDALVRLGGEVPRGAAPRPLEKVERLLRPRSIAVMGVSSRGMNPGRIILRNVVRQGFPREHVYVVKPGLEELDGCRCVPDLAALPERPVDLLVVCLDATQLPDLLDDVIDEERAESVILIAGGLGERQGSEGHVDRIRQTLERSRRSPGRGPVVNGGNCLGVRSLPGNYDTVFIPKHKLRYAETDEPTPLALISQSGAFAVARASWLPTLNPRYLATLGNQIDLTVGDYLEVLAEDDEVEVFACYVEGFRPEDGRRWLESASRITASGRPVILYRAGRTPAGAAATASHTASIAGDYAVTRALAASAGVFVADTLEDFDDLVRLACALGRKEVSGSRLGALSNAGFECVAMADNLGPFSLPEFTGNTRARLADLLAAHRLESIVGVKNLLDLTPIVGDATYEEAVRAVLDDENVDVGVIGCVPLSGALATVAPAEGHAEDVADDEAVGRRLARIFANSTKAWVGVVDGGPLYDDLARLLAARGVPTFRAADRALRLFGRYVRWRLAHPR